MNQLTPIVKNLLIVNVVFFLGTFALESSLSLELINERVIDFWAWKRNILAAFYPTSIYFRPYQLLTHMFMHANISHLFFNMFGLYMFGPPLERILGEKRFFIFYLVAGFGAVALHMFVTYLELNYGGLNPLERNIPMLGASGAIFGLLAGFGTKFPNVIIRLLIPPIPLKAKYFVLIYGGIELFMGIGNYGGGIAHFAHVGGAIFGFLLMKYWEKFR